MALSIDWPTKVINVPKADMLLVQSVPTEIRELDIDAFRLELKSIESSTEGMPFLDTHSHSPPVTVGGVTLARVVEIINGYTITFEDGQYAVNLVGANSNIGDVVNVNQVSVRSANSAGLTYSKEIEDLSFTDNRIWIDTGLGVDSTQYPAGTPALPTSSFENGVAIAQNRGLPNRFHGVGAASVTGFDLTQYDLLGASREFSSLTIGSGCTTTGLVLERMGLPDCILNGYVAIRFCAIQDLYDAEGSIWDSGLSGTITIGSSEYIEFINCHSDVSGASGTPIIDCQNLPNIDLSIRGYAGGLRIINCSASNSNISIDLVAGHVILDSSVTAGDITVRGAGYITDNGTANPNIEGLTWGTSGLTAAESTQLGQIDVLRKLMQNRMETNPTTGVMTIYDDDDVTPFLTGNIYEDVLAAQAYRGRGLERRNRLT